MPQSKQVTGLRCDASVVATNGSREFAKGIGWRRIFPAYFARFFNATVAASRYPSVMSIDSELAAARRNKANYLAAKAAFNARDLDRCLAYYALDHRLGASPTISGREGIRAFLEAALADWADVQIMVENVIAEGDWVMGRSLITATGAGVPEDQKVEANFWDLHRFDEHGLICETWNLLNRAPSAALRR